MPRDGTANRQRILDAAEHLVIDNGYAATSVDQVIAASGTSKGAFFHHFASKVELARALVQRYAAADVAHLHDALARVRRDSDDPVRRVIDFVRIFEDDADALMDAQSSCLYVAVLTERQLVADGTADDIRAAIVAWRDGFADLLREAFAVRPSSLDPVALSDHVFVTFEGAFVLCRSTGDPSHMRAQLQVLRQLLEAVFA